MKTATTILHSAVGFAFLAACSVQAADDVMIVFDGSNSMWGQIDGVAKIEIARQAMHSLMGDWIESTNVGLVAYGHRRQGDCTDIETLIPVGPVDRDSFMAHINSIVPRGRTPLTAAIESAAETLSYRDRPATIVVITDGIETCQRDPCALAEELSRRGVGLTAHVIGFDLSGEDQLAVSCIAEQTGGRFIPAGNATELGQALSEVGAAVAATSRPEPEPEPQPDPSVELTVPSSATTGEAFSVSWTSTEQYPEDYVTIVPVGAAEGEYASYTRVGTDSEGSLRAPAEAGLYEVRYVLLQGARTLASADIEIVEAEVTVNAPERATIGSSFAVRWTGNIHTNDYVTIVPAGAGEGQYTDYIRVGTDSEGNLRAPAEAGMYEVRYVLQEGSRTMASTDIEIVDAKVTVTAPENATTGSSFAVSWTGNIHTNDYVTIVPAGAAEGQYTDYSRVGTDSKGSLRAPAEAGMYEVRYVLQQGGRTMAFADIEITEADIELSAPDKARAGTSVTISWTGSVPHGSDYVTIVPMGADEGSYGDYARVGTNSQATLNAPRETGLYEVRYILATGSRTLARHMLEVVDEAAALDTGGSLTVPATGNAGDQVEVSWTSTSESADQRITLARPDQADFTWIEAQRTNNEPPLFFTLPAESGTYEFRLLDVTNRSILSRSIIEVQ